MENRTSPSAKKVFTRKLTTCSATKAKPRTIGSCAICATTRNMLVAMATPMVMAMNTNPTRAHWSHLRLEKWPTSAAGPHRRKSGGAAAVRGPVSHRGATAQEPAKRRDWPRPRRRTLLGVERNRRKHWRRPPARRLADYSGILPARLPVETVPCGWAADCRGTSAIVPHCGHLAFFPALSSGVRSSLAQPGQRNSIGMVMRPEDPDYGAACGIIAEISPNIMKASNATNAQNTSIRQEHPRRRLAATRLVCRIHADNQGHQVRYSSHDSAANGNHLVHRRRTERVADDAKRHLKGIVRAADQLQEEMD